MTLKDDESVRQTVESIYHAESRRVLATLIRLLGDFELAEEALHDAFRNALEQWLGEGAPSNARALSVAPEACQAEGVPSTPRAWLVPIGRSNAIDNRRRNARFDSLDEVGAAA